MDDEMMGLHIFNNVPHSVTIMGSQIGLFQYTKIQLERDVLRTKTKESG